MFINLLYVLIGTTLFSLALTVFHLSALGTLTASLGLFTATLGVGNLIRHLMSMVFKDSK